MKQKIKQTYKQCDKYKNILMKNLKKARKKIGLNLSNFLSCFIN
mgnify:CR=1 FL=1